MKSRLAPALRYYRSLPAPRLAGYLAGVFLTFSSLGFMADTWRPPVQRAWDWAPALATAAIDGAIAVLFALSAMRSFWLLPVAIASMALGLRGIELVWRARAAVWGAVPADIGAVEHRLALDAACAIVAVILGYVLSVRFIRVEGVRQTRLRAEMELAREIHASLVPPVELAAAAGEARGRSVPSSEVGGDLVDAFEREGRLVACVADVAGHGVPAGTLMAMIRSAVRLELDARGRLETLLADLNRLLLDLRRPDRFVTLACMRFDGGGAADYALAGHLPILRVPSGARAVERLENESLPLGVRAGATFAAGRVTAAAGDLFAIFTDGLSEARDQAQREFGIERLEALLLEHAARPLKEIERLVFAAVKRHGRQLDDQTLLLVRVR